MSDDDKPKPEPESPKPERPAPPPPERKLDPDRVYGDDKTKVDLNLGSDD